MCFLVPKHTRGLGARMENSSLHFLMTFAGILIIFNFPLVKHTYTQHKKLLGSLFIPYNNLYFLVFAGRDDCVKYVEFTTAGHREELETVGRLSPPGVKLAFKHRTTRKTQNYQNQDIMGCHQEVKQAITLSK